MKNIKSIEYFNQLRSETHLQAFEVEDVVTRKNYTFIYNPYEKFVKCIDTSRNSDKNIMFKAEDGFQLQNGDKRKFENIYDYFVYLYKSAIHDIENEYNKNIFFIGWVESTTIRPYEDDNVNYYSYCDIDKLKSKIISKHLDDKLQYFIETILPSKYKEAFVNNAYFAGGCLSALFGAYEEISDYDIFLKDINICGSMVDYFKEIYIEEAKSNKIKNGLPVPYNRFYSILYTRNAISFISTVKASMFQIILRDSGNPMGVISRFDFTHSMLAYDCKDKFIYSSRHAIESCKNKRLEYNSACPTDISSIARVLKFCKKGMTINKLQCGYILKKIYSQIKNDNIKENDIMCFLQDSYYDERTELGE